MSKIHDSRKQIRLWPENERRLKELNATFPISFSLSQLANMVLRDGWPAKKKNKQT